MTDNIPPSAQVSPPQMTPPSQTQPPQEAPSTSSWPTVVGVISIVWASLRLIGIPLWLLVSNFPDWYITFATASSLLGIALAVLLLVAGICLLKYIRASRVLHMTYAGVTIARVVVGLIIVITVEFPLLLESGMPRAFAIVDICGAIVLTAVVMAWPIFLLVWFRRRKIRQQVQGW